MIVVFYLAILVVGFLCKFGLADDSPCSDIPGCQKQYSYQPPSSRLTHYCFDVVDYDYFLPTGMTQAMLDALVKAKLDAPELYIMTVDCQKLAKRMACGRAFLKYAQSGDTNIYSNIALPFHRPCLSLCVVAKNSCPLMPLDCSEQTDKYVPVPIGQNPPLINVYGNENTCNTVDPASELQIAPQAEDYRGKACANIHPPGTKVIIPPANVVSSSFANFQPPYFVQALIDQQISASFSTLPSFMKKDCHLALRKYICGKYFLVEEVVTIGDAMKVYAAQNSGFAFYGSETTYLQIVNPNNSPYLTSILKYFYNYKISLPSYPHKNVCLDYKDKCADFIKNAANPALLPDCSLIDARKIDNWPTTQNVVLVTPAYLPPILPELYYLTPPNMMTLAVDKDSEDKDFETNCPSTFVVPDNPNNPLVQWITGTGCALPCKRNIWTPDEWVSFDSVADVIPSVGIVCIVALFIMWVLDKQRRKQYLVVFFTGSSMIATLFFNFMSNEKNITRGGSNTALCVDNAVQITDEDGSTVCASQAVVIFYCALACCLSWLVQAFDLFQKLILDIKNTERFFWYHVSFIFGLPLIPTIILLSWKVYGYGGNLPWCFVSSKSREEDDIVIFYIPILIITIFGVFFMSCVISKIVYTLWISSHMNSADSNGSAESQKFLIASKVLRIPILFVILFLLCWVSLFSYRSQTYNKRVLMKESMITWIQCVFKNWNGQSDESWSSVCGAHLEDRVPARLAFWITFCVTGQSILISVIFLLNPRLTFPSDLHAFLKDYVPFLRPYLPELKGGSTQYGRSYASGTDSPSSDNSRFSFVKKDVSKVYIDESIPEGSTGYEYDSTTTSNSTQSTVTAGAVIPEAIDGVGGGSGGGGDVEMSKNSTEDKLTDV